MNTNYAYDNLSRLLSVLHQAGSTTLDGAGYTYDNAGNRVSKTNYLNNVTEGYSYDPLYQLTQVTQGASTTESYSYDAVGNRLSSLGVSPYSYNSSNELTATSSGSYTYDANGNTLTDAQGLSFTWDFENRLTQVTVPQTGGGSNIVTFKYDPFGRRIQKASASGITNYLYDGATSLEEVDNGGTAVGLYTQGPSIDEPLSELRSGTASYYHADALGTVTSLANSSGSVVNAYAYDSFGQLTASTGSISNTFKFTARDSDVETGLYFYRARYYLPSAGRFISEDPIGFNSGDINFYPYSVNNPVDLFDPSGLTWESNNTFFWDWVLGRGPRRRPYGPNDVQTQEMQDSISVQTLREKFYQNGCRDIRSFSYGTYEAYWDTVANPWTADWSSTAAQVGGYSGASAINNGNGTVTFTIPNTAGAHSFFLHLVPNVKSPTGPMSNIEQVFQWTEYIQRQPPSHGGTNCKCNK